MLTFVADHHLIQNCDASGSGDAAIYPGSSADVGEQGVAEDGLPAERFSTEIRWCDMHHSSAGYSGTAANAVWLHHNNFYDNALGFTTDVFTAAGHPGFPQDSDLVENNNFFSNNFNPYEEGSDDRSDHPRPGRHGRLDRRRQQQHLPQQPHVGQLAPRRDAVRRPRRPGLRHGPAVTSSTAVRRGSSAPPSTTSSTTT